MSQITSLKKTKLFLGEFQTTKLLANVKGRKKHGSKTIMYTVFRLSFTSATDISKSKQILSQLTLKLQNNVKTLHIVMDFFSIHGIFFIKMSFYPYIKKINAVMFLR